MKNFILSIINNGVNYRVGYLGPGGYQEAGKYLNCTGGVSNYIDTQFLGYEHLYMMPTFVEIYFEKHMLIPFDPEGFFCKILLICIDFV